MCTTTHSLLDSDRNSDHMLDEGSSFEYPTKFPDLTYYLPRVEISYVSFCATPPIRAIHHSEVQPRSQPEISMTQPNMSEPTHHDHHELTGWPRPIWSPISRPHIFGPCHGVKARLSRCAAWNETSHNLNPTLTS